MTQNTIGTDLVAGSWTIDPAHSSVGFTVRHLMSKVRGTFTDVTGSITTTQDPLDSKIDVSISTASINTNNAQRDAHVRSTDFFDAVNGQQLVFVSTGVRAGDEGYLITGDLTINGVTQPVDLTAEFLGVAVDAYGVTRLGAEATTSISRKTYGVDANVPLDGGKLLIGDKVDISLEIEATLV